VENAIRCFVQEERRERRQVTGRQVLDHLLELEYIHVPKDDTGLYKKTKLETAYRSCRRWLERHGYNRGRRKGNIVMKEHVALLRDQYLTKFFANEALPQDQRL
jgi:hypothetical protein